MCKKNILHVYMYIYVYVQNMQNIYQMDKKTVSYTHLTLPTKLEV